MTMAVSQIPSQFWVPLGETPRQQLGLTLLAPAQRSLCFFFFQKHLLVGDDGNKNAGREGSRATACGEELLNAGKAPAACQLLGQFASVCEGRMDGQEGCVPAACALGSRAAAGRAAVAFFSCDLAGRGKRDAGESETE